MSDAVKKAIELLEYCLGPTRDVKTTKIREALEQLKSLKPFPSREEFVEFAKHLDSDGYFGALDAHDYLSNCHPPTSIKTNTVDECVNSDTKWLTDSDLKQLLDSYFDPAKEYSSWHVGIYLRDKLCQPPSALSEDDHKFLCAVKGILNCSNDKSYDVSRENIERLIALALRGGVSRE